MFNKLRRLRHSIINIIRWFPLIWNDNDWDSYYLFKIMGYKIKNMEQYFRVHGHLVCSEKQAKEMKIAYLLLKRLTDDIYSDMVFKEFDEKWGKANFSINDDGSLNISYENEKTPEDKIERINELMKTFKKEDYLKEQDVNYLFDLMKKKILEWSD